MFCDLKLLYIAFCICSCILLKLDTRLLNFIKNLNLYNAVFYTVSYKYTSEENFARYLEYLKLGVDTSCTASYVTEIEICDIYGAQFVYHQIFVPCNLTSGTPRPLCSRFCYFFRSNCKSNYDKILKYANVFEKDIIIDDCTNTFQFQNKVSNFTNSSKDFEDDCVDFPGECIAENFSYQDSQ